MHIDTIRIHPQIEHFLTVWAFWECRLQEGWGDMVSPTALAVALVKPDYLTREYKSRSPYINELADRMNFIIKHQLEKESPKHADALRIIYLAEARRRKELLQDRDITKQTLYRWGREAKTWLTEKVEQDHFFDSYL